MYQLLAIDMDGTLLTSDKQLTQRTIEAVQEAKAKGVKVVLASGRPFVGMKPYLDQLGICGENEYVISFNGSIAYQLSDMSPIYQATLNGKAAKEVLNVATSIGLHFHAFSEKLGAITPKMNPYTYKETLVNKIEVIEVDFSELDDEHPIIKTLAVGEPSDVTAARLKVPNEMHEKYAIVQSAPYFLEFLNPNASKGNALAKVCQMLDIDSDKVIAFGDAQNDNSMLKFAGLGVAMGNAMEETKQVANLIAESNNDDGVAKIIEGYVL